MILKISPTLFLALKPRYYVETLAGQIIQLKNSPLLRIEKPHSTLLHGSKLRFYVRRALVIWRAEIQ